MGYNCYHVLFNGIYVSQGGYAVDYATQGARGAFPGNFMDKNSQGGYSRFSGSNDFMFQVCFTWPYLLTLFFYLHLLLSLLLLMQEYM